MSINFTPLPSGQWGVRMSGSDAFISRRGDVVRVAKSNGEEKTVTLDSMVVGEGTDTETWSIVETKPVAAARYRVRRATSGEPLPTRKPPRGEPETLSVKLDAMLTTGPSIPTPAVAETDEETLARIFGSLAASATGVGEASEARAS